MPRSNRVFLAGGIYHVYARVARGEPVFANDEKVNHLAEVLSKHPGSLSNASSRFAKLRSEDPKARRRFEKVAAELRRRLPG
jgi:hypothetical protein